MSDRPDGLTTPEWAVIQEMRRKALFSRGYNAGIEEVAQKAESWATEAGGGSGVGGEGFRNFAVVIRAMKKDL